MKVLDTTPTSAVSGSHSSIAELPPEILLMIFKFIFMETRYKLELPCPKRECVVENGCLWDHMPYGEHLWTGGSNSPPFAQFPTSVTLVCPRWEEVMLSVPTFWTYIVIHLDADFFSSRKLQRQLCASGNQPIEVVVTRTSFSDTTGLKDKEWYRMVQVITALRSHIHRCRILKFKVIHSSSLPRLLAILPSSMPYIQKLILESCIDSGCPKVQLYSQADHISLIDRRKLKTIRIDGWNFVELYNHTPNQQIFSACHSLSIKYGGDGFSSSNIMRLVTDCPLEDLEVESVDFGMGDEPEDDSSIQFLTLRNLSAEVTDVMLGLFNLVDELTIDNCPTTLTTILPGTNGACLKNISSDQSLRDFLRMWFGSSFRVIKCPGFNDDILKLMGRMSRSFQNSHLSGMEDLYIHNCYNFTLEALKQLVVTRFNNDMMFQTLEVAKYGFSLFNDEVTLFTDRVAEFRWTV